MGRLVESSAVDATRVALYLRWFQLKGSSADCRLERWMMLGQVLRTATMDNPSPETSEIRVYLYRRLIEEIPLFIGSGENLCPQIDVSIIGVY